MLRALSKLKEAHDRANSVGTSLGWGAALAFVLANPVLALIPLGAAAAVVATEVAVDGTKLALAVRKKRRDEARQKAERVKAAEESERLEHEKRVEERVAYINRPTLKELLAEFQRDFEEDCAAIRALPLDDAEKQARINAKIDLLARETEYVLEHKDELTRRGPELRGP